jgi:hypothetical protein
MRKLSGAIKEGSIGGIEISGRQIRKEYSFFRSSDLIHAEFFIPLAALNKTHFGRGWRKADIEAGETAKSCVLSPFELILQKNRILKALDQHVERDLALDARKRRTETKVRRPAKGYMPVIGSD